MIGIILTTIGTFFDEISLSIGKWEVLNNRENLYTFGFLNYFWTLIIFIVIAIIKNKFVFDIASIPILIVLIVLQTLQIYSSLKGIILADRSTSGFLMVITIPLLLLVDMFLGYKIGIIEIVGISIIVISLILLSLNHGLSKKGIGYVIFSSINAVATISIYKYCITHYNSVEAQQIITLSFLLIFLFIMSMWKFKQNPFLYLFKKEFLFQSIFTGIGGVFISISYVYAPASIITGARRAFSVLWSIASGSKLFHERHILIKIFSSILIITGLVFLIL